MNSPYGNKPMQLRFRSKKLALKGETFPVTMIYYYCTETNQEFTTNELDSLTLYQAYWLYAEKHNLPIEEVKPKPTNMLITRKSTQSGIESTLDLPVTEEQMQEFYSGKGLIQNIFSNLTAYQRDFIKFGFTEEEWKDLYGDDKQPNATTT